MQNIRNIVADVLTKVDQLLTTEPARVIGYGAAVVVYLVARVLADRGFLSVQLTFDQSITAALGAMASLVIVVESIRRFVYSPQTYIEDIADESDAAHEAAHIEDSLRRWKEAIKAREDAQQADTIEAKVGSGVSVQSTKVQ